jgi:hypothetical protein
MNHLCERIAKERNCSPELVRAITTDFVAAMHEASFKRGIGTALSDAYLELTPVGAWHFMGLLADAAESEPGELIEHYERQDSTLQRFASIAEQWKFELEQEREREKEKSVVRSKGETSDQAD